MVQKSLHALQLLAGGGSPFEDEPVGGQGRVKGNRVAVSSLPRFMEIEPLAGISGGGHGCPVFNEGNVGWLTAAADFSSVDIG